MSSLNTFGSILTYAIQLETSLRDYYQSAGQADRAADADKRRSMLERIRREYVVEITLEPIEGLNEADYHFNFDDPSAEAQAANEKAAARFYTDAAPKINVRQAQRSLEKCAQQHSALTP